MEGQSARRERATWCERRSCQAGIVSPALSVSVETVMKTLLDPVCYQELLTRFRALDPETLARWGTLTAPRMLTHLSDQMRYTLGEFPVRSRSGVLRWPIVKQLVMYWLPWPKGRVKGSPEMFLTAPTTWTADLATFQTLLDRFINDTSRNTWPEHPRFGPMTYQSWGRFCHRHFDHHLRQFGV
jgi:Protein of unknown function (DUF1569)